jgi:TrwC relaxase
VAVVATLGKGYDLEYIWKQVDRGAAKDAASYYIQASESGGEPPGRWWGPGAKALGYNEHIGAVAAIVSQHLEEALTQRFGLEWTARDDGHGFEIKGISGGMMCMFSSRRASITADLRVRAARFEQRYGRAPSQRELAQLAQASNFKTRAAKDGALDFAQLHAG